MSKINDAPLEGYPTGEKLSRMVQETQPSGKHRYNRVGCRYCLSRLVPVRLRHRCDLRCAAVHAHALGCWRHVPELPRRGSYRRHPPHRLCLRCTLRWASFRPVRPSPQHHATGNLVLRWLPHGGLRTEPALHVRCPLHSRPRRRWSFCNRARSTWPKLLRSAFAAPSSLSTSS